VSLAKKLEFYLKNTDKAEEHGRNAAQKMRQQYNFEKYYEKLEEVIEQAFKEVGKPYK
jgi:predicted RNA-binding protein with RPS1 domain